MSRTQQAKQIAAQKVTTSRRRQKPRQRPNTGNTPYPDLQTTSQTMRYDPKTGKSTPVGKPKTRNVPLYGISEAQFNDTTPPRLKYDRDPKTGRITPKPQMSERERNRVNRENPPMIETRSYWRDTKTGKLTPKGPARRSRLQSISKQQFEAGDKPQKKK